MAGQGYIHTLRGKILIATIGNVHEWQGPRIRDANHERSGTLPIGYRICRLIKSALAGPIAPVTGITTTIGVAAMPQ